MQFRPWCSSTAWEATTHAGLPCSFFERGFRVHALDRRGRGASGDGPAHSVDQEARDIAAVVESLGSEVSLVAHSFGALCAAEAALLIPRPGRLVLYEPPFLPRIDGSAGSELAGLERLVAGGRREAALRRFMEVVVGMSPHDVERVMAPESWYARVAWAHTVVRELRAACDHGFDECRWGSCAAPVLLLVGERSPVHLTEPARRLNRVWPNSRLVALAGQGHVAMDRDPDGFVRAVLEFLTAAT